MYSIYLENEKRNDLQQKNYKNEKAFPIKNNDFSYPQMLKNKKIQQQSNFEANSKKKSPIIKR